MRPARTRRQLVVCSLLAASACTSEGELGYWTARERGGASGSPSEMPVRDDVDMRDAAAFDPPKSGVTDGAVGPPLCLRNPSFDGIPHSGPIVPATWWAAESWNLCWNDAADFPDPSMALAQICAVTIVNDATTIDPQDGTGARAGLLPRPTHGVVYLHFDTLLDVPERTSQTLCADLLAGVTYNFAIDLMSRAGQTHEGAVLGTGVLELFASNSMCNHTGEPLWRSPPLTTAWQTYCVSITPRQRASVLTLQMPAKGHPRSAILVDNIRLSEACGPAVVD